MSAHPNPDGAVLRVLVVCTGNVCRSPYVELRLKQALGDAPVAVSSAGTGALVGHGVEEGSARLLEARGVDASGFEARQLTPEMVREADVVLTATRQHGAEVARLEASGLRKTFALVDFADLVARVPEGPFTPSFLDPLDATPASLFVSAVGRQRGKVAARPDGEADVVDPFRQGPEVFDRMAAQVEAVLPAVVAGLRRFV